MKIKLRTIKDDLKNNRLTVRFVFENGNEGLEQTTSYDVWDSLPLRKVGKNLYEYEVTDKEEKEAQIVHKRLDWLKEQKEKTSRVIIIKRLGISPSTEDLYFLGGFMKEYCKATGGTPGDFRSDIDLFIMALQMSINGGGKNDNNV